MASPTTRVCPVCSYKGMTNNLKLYQINEDEAIYMCTSKTCSYPIGTCDPALLIVKRPIPELKEEENDEPTVPKKDAVSNGVHKPIEETCRVEQNKQDSEDTMKSELDLMLEGILSEETS